MPLHQLNYDCFELIYNELNTKAKISFLNTLTESKEYAPIINHLKSFPITINAYDSGRANFVINRHKWFKDIDYSLHIYQIVQLLDDVDLLLDLKFDFNDHLSEDTYKSILNDKYYHNINSITLKNCQGNEFVFAKNSKWNSKVIELLKIYSDDASNQDLQLSNLSNLKKLHLHFHKTQPDTIPQDLHLDELIITLDNNIRYDFLQEDESHVPTGITSLSIPVNASKDAMAALVMANRETLQSLTLSIVEPFFSDIEYLLPILQHIGKFPHLKQVKTNGYFDTSVLEGSNVDDVSMGVLNDRILEGSNNDLIYASKICYDEDVEGDLGVFESFPDARKLSCPDITLYDDSTKLKKLTIHGLSFGPRDATRFINNEFPRSLEELEVNFLSIPRKFNGRLLDIPPRIKKLTLSNLGLFHPPDIPASTIYLDLSGNMLTYYPDLTRNERLVYLDLSSNGIKPSPLVTNNVVEGVVMGNIDFLKNLKHLKVRTQRFEDKYIKNLKSLETLYIQSPEYIDESKSSLEEQALILPPNLKACTIELGDPKTQNWKWRICSEYPVLKLPDSLYELTIQLPQKRVVNPESFAYLKDSKIKILKFYASIETTKENPLYLSDELEIFKSKSALHTPIWFKFPPNSSTQLRSVSAFPFVLEQEHATLAFENLGEDNGVTHPHLDQRQIYVHQYF